MNQLINKVQSISFRLLRYLDKWISKLPFVKNKINVETEHIINNLESSVKPYKNKFNNYKKIPDKGVSNENIIKEIEEMSALEERRWKNGYVSGAIYHGDTQHINLLNKIYALQSQSNPLHSDLFPSASKFESEIIAMTANMLGASTNNGCFGTVNSGGTESILLAMKTYRDWAKEEKKIFYPEIIVPVTAHAAFDKAGEYFNIRVIRTPVDINYKANVKKIKKSISSRTIAIVVSAVTFPHGIIDPIKEIALIAKKYNIGLHVDACLGGFILPWAEKLGYKVEPFDFRLPGVSSISADTHKYGYAAKGTSVLLYKNNLLRQYQYFTATDWPGGLYMSPTFAGSRPGALSATCWAAMIAMGEDGYLNSAKKILETAEYIKKGIEDIDELYILGKPLWVISFTSKSLDIYRILDFMSNNNWNLNGLHNPSCIHICVTLRHTIKGVSKRFIKDLRQAVIHVNTSPKEEQGMAPIYGMAAKLPLRSVISDLLKNYLDLYYKVSEKNK